MADTDYIVDDSRLGQFGTALSFLEYLQGKYPDMSRQELANKYIDEETRETMRCKGLL